MKVKVEPVLDEYDLGLIKYVAGYTLYKTKKHKAATKWEPAITFLTTSSSTDSNNNFLP